jgi:hypothetical protein
MRSVLISLVFAATLFAQDKPAVVAAACGNKDIQFDVKKDGSQHLLVQPDPGKARIYFVQDFGQTQCFGHCGITVRVGLSGVWVGANEDNSYFSVSVEPGEHHLCATPQAWNLKRLVGLAHFTAEAGKTYYFRTRLFGEQNQQLIDLTPIDSDQAGYLITSYPLSVSHPKP